jgi:integrase
MADKLTDVAIKAARPRESPYKLSDGKGMFLLVNPNGSRWWRLKYRIGGKEKLLSFGCYPEVRLGEARKLRDEARGLLRTNKDPAAVRKIEKLAAQNEAQNTFEAIAREFIDKQKVRWKTDAYAAHILRRLELNVFPELGRRPIAEIEAIELLSVLQDIEKRGARDQAHRVLSICGQVFRYGVATGRCKYDIAASLRGALAPHKRRKMPAVRPEELPDLLGKIDGYDGELQTRLGLQLLALTFVPTGELIKAKWSEFDLDRKMWAVPQERMKRDRGDHLVPLSRQAVAILEELHDLNAQHEYVFPGRQPYQHISNNTLLFALYRLGYRGKMSGHGFRAVADTTLAELRSLGRHQFSDKAVDLQLAHQRKDQVKAAYDRSELLPERQALLQWWANYLDELRVTSRAVD